MAEATKSSVVLWSQGILAAAIGMAIYLVQDTRNTIEEIRDELTNVKIQFAKLPPPEHRTDHHAMELRHLEMLERIHQLESHIGSNR